MKRMTMRRRYMNVIRSRAGVGTIEFALLVPAISVLLLGVVDFGLGFWQQMQVANAAQAGVQYAQLNGWSTTGVPAAVQNATNLPVTVNATQTYGCADATGGITETTSGASCPNGTTAVQYDKVTASVSYTTIFPWPGIARPMTLSATSWTQ